MLDPDASHAVEAEQPRRLNPRRAIKDEIALADEHRRAEAERADRIGDLAHMRRIQFADLARRHPQLVKRNVASG